MVYTGVDISYNLLKIANADYPDARWVHKDMVSFLMNAKPEEYDVIIGVASFHHLPTQQLRSLALDSMYACLAYEGACIMTNRCYSDWFRQKYRREIRLASWKSIATLGYKDKNDIMVPWKENDGKIVSTRLYHIFSQKELSRLFLGSGFSHIKHVYVDNTGKETSAEQEGRNLITVGRKTIYQE
ncbi:class I SAM-dependent methyltransferase [Patescibacteria group bacterium]|nr:class I SAM-dependent methyltransferase [Patescibacteria group bacterium]